MMFRRYGLLVTLFSSALFLLGCENLTKRSESVTIQLDTFNLVGNGGTDMLRAVVTGNPACTAENTSLNSLLAQVDNYDDIVDYLDSLDINQVQYRITSNNTPADTVGSMQMSDPDTGQLQTIASINIPENSLVEEWTALPFEDGGAAIAQHYMDNLADEFLYCANGSPDESTLSMTLELRLQLTVTIDLL